MRSDTPTQGTVEIPRPPTRLILGNLPELRRKPTAIESLADLGREYGGIVQLATPMGRIVAVTDPALAYELCDDERFDKVLGPGLLQVRQRIGAGLFTSRSDEKEWGMAHRILMPTFSLHSMKEYVPDMIDLTFQLMDTLDRRCREGVSVDVPAEMTKLTLDTIALCGFSYRFDSFQRDSEHPFIKAMMEVLTEQQKRVARPPVLNQIMVGARKRQDAASRVMNDIVSEIVSKRRESGPLGGRRDLLEYMLSGVDKVTGESLSDENIRSQCLTFLVAGHETTSGLLSFALYYLLKNPQFAVKAREEIDRIWGTDETVPPTYEQIHALDYVTAILEETLRLYPTAPAITRGPKKEPGEILGGKYFLPYGEGCMLVIGAIQRAPEVWGADAEEFRPERFLPEGKAQREGRLAVYLPFGTGARACIGRQFALQEAKLVLAMLLRRFELVDSESYQLRVKQSLTIKPDGFYLKLRRRRLEKVASTTQVVVGRSEPSRESEFSQEAGVRPGPGSALNVFFGSNLGTCELLANEFATEARQRGFETKLCCLDDAPAYVETTPSILICSSYNGQPPDNAVKFMEKLSELRSLPPIGFAVFGCGNKEWANTYQRVPRLLDEQMAQKGARRLIDLGEGDASGDLDTAFRQWKQKLWAALSQELGLPEVMADAPRGPLYSVEFLEEFHPNPFAEAYQAAPMVVVENRELQDFEKSHRSTRHIELALPEGYDYRPGDHLGVIPVNSSRLVERVAATFHLHPETRLKLHKRSEAPGVLPVDKVLSVGQILTHYLELQATATRRQLEILATYASTEGDRKRLSSLAEDAELYQREVFLKRRSVAVLLEEMPTLELPFAVYLEMAPALRPRYYSIASSCELQGRLLSLTVGVVEAPARFGKGTFQGTCSSYLGGLQRGQSIYAFTVDNQAGFGLPATATQPLIMIGAGTGLAPYLGFLQEREALQKSGRPIGEALLFFGCRHSDHDYLYRERLERYHREGLVKLVTAFSREGSEKVYVQHRLLEHGETVFRLLQDGAVLYICGDASGMAAGVREALLSLLVEHGRLNSEQALQYLETLTAERRYLLDVWASS